MSLSFHELWTAIIPLCLVGLIYFGGEALRDEIKIENQKPWRWGDKPRRAPHEATWGTHTALGVATFLLVIFSINMLRLLGG